MKLAISLALGACLLMSSPAKAEMVGKASFYGTESGRTTANGERFDPDGISAAHWTLPFGTRVRVEDIATGKSIVVRINDRGPHPRLRRLIDLSRGAARQLGIISRGIANVRVTIVG